MKQTYLIVLLVLLFLIACTEADTGNEANPYNDALNKAWEQFKLANYSESKTLFRDAKKINIELPDAYIGLAWTFVKLDSLNQAIANFSIANSKDNKIETLAGWGFTLNAQKDYTNSNIKITDALIIDSVWVFKFDTKYNHIDLKIVKAENYFALNQFSQALSAVKKVNPVFNANVNTFEGQSALVNEIERLRKEN